MRKSSVLKVLTVIIMAIVMVVPMAACGNNNSGGGNGEGGSTTGGGKIKITVSIPAASSAQYSWQAMEDAYEKLPGNENINVVIETNTNAADYQQKLMMSLSGGVNNVSADIVVANEAGQYLTSCFADYMPYLNKKNPYADNQIWRDTLESAAYATYGGEDKLYTLSFDTTQVFIAYSKVAFKNAGIDASSIKTWDDLVDACETLSQTAVPGLTGYSYVPMTFGGTKESMGMPLGWLVRVYSDQYFRDFTEVAHSQSGDYTYDPEVDADWTAPVMNLADNATVDERIAAINADSSQNYTANPLRVLDAYFNSGDGVDNNAFNPLGDRWQDMMSNLYRIFGNPDYLNPQLDQDYGTALTHMYTSRGGMAVVASDFFVAYSQQKGLNMNQVMQAIGVIDLPPMTDYNSDGVGAPASNYTRALGGPNGFFGVVNKSKEQTDAAMDFLMFVFSKQGQEVRLNSLAQNKGSLNGPVLVKDVEIPESLQLTTNVLKEAAGGIDYYGESDYNPILLVSNGLRSYNGSYEAHIDDELKSLYYNYFNPNAGSDKIGTVSDLGEKVFALMKKYQSDYFSLMNYRSDCLTNVAKDPTAV